MKIKYLLFFFLAFVVLKINGQVINGYATVTAIAGNTLTLDFVDEAGDTFEDGEDIIIMQVQDNVIGTNTANNVSFGDLSLIASAGLYEIRQIASHTESLGLPTTITLNVATTNTYNINVNSTVQIITFPKFGSPNYTTTSDMSARAWDGNNGGVLAFNIDGDLTLAHNLTADNAGFRAGLRSSNYYAGGTGCTATGNFIRTSNHTRAGAKGEGIYKATNINNQYAKGKLINGGGGGAERINAGGGGGGNFTNGGFGGYGWSCSTSPGGGGVGGIALSSHISASRIFLGGGGGGGQQNNSASTDGTNGGGIIIIKADTIRTSGACGGISITANANNVPNGGNDGQGGGGAGGSIVIEVVGWVIAPTCTITVSANGGNGGNVISGPHAGGGGGGQGVVIYSIAQPTINTTTTTNNGAAGCGDTGCNPTYVTGPGGGTNSTGIISGSTGPLPIDLINFTAESNDNRTVDINWETASETNNDYFIVERSQDIQNWYSVEKISGAGNSSSKIKYSTIDYNPSRGNSYYRLTQVDFDGTTTRSGIKTVNIIQVNLLNVYPNPTNNILFIEKVGISANEIILYNALGQTISAKKRILNSTSNQIALDVANLPAGIYFIKIQDKTISFTKQ